MSVIPSPVLAPISRSELERCSDAWDAAVESDSAIDPFCTRSAWQLSYHDAFCPERPLWLARQDRNWVVLAEHNIEGIGLVLESLENMWGFASPLIGDGAASLLAASLSERAGAVVLLGLPLDHSRLAPLARALNERFSARSFKPTTRLVASLSGGIDGWLSRRSRSFRRNLRVVMRRLSNAGVSFRRFDTVGVEELPALYERVLDVESRSWKGACEEGADIEPMRSFYSQLWTRLARDGQLRLIFAEQRGRTVGYLHGAVVGSHFRGLQFSFDDSHRELGLGNALQFEMLRWICEAGVTAYDMGSHSEYKNRWAEPGLCTFGLLLEPL